MGKRERDEESEAVLAAQQLEAAADSEGDDRKTKAIAAVVASIDAADEQYEAQKELAENGALTALASLLEDAAEAVSIAATDALLKLTQHSPAVLNRLYVGGGFAMGNPDSVSYNPVQSEVLDLGIISTLVKLQFEGSEMQSDAAFAALAALGAYNRPNKLATLRELVRRLIDGHSKAVPAVETLLDGLEFKDDVAVVLDQALAPLLGTLSSGKTDEQRAAASLLGLILVKRPNIADFLVAEGALKTVIKLLTTGDADMVDVAVRAAWGLVKDSQRLLRPEADALGVPGTALVKPLMDTLLRSKEDVGEGEEEKEGADNTEEALALLRALSRADPDVKAKFREDDETDGADASKPLCTIM